MPTNKERAEFAGRTLEYFADLVGEIGEAPQILITDLLANLMHYCDDSDPHVYFDDALRVASGHHMDEALDEKGEGGFTCQCQSCATKWRDIDVLPVADILRRIEPGDIFPSGECPKCGAMCLPIKEDEPDPEQKLWTIQYESDDGPQVEIARCDHAPTFKEILAEFEHLKTRVDAGEDLTAEDFTVLEYQGIPIIP